MDFGEQEEYVSLAKEYTKLIQSFFIQIIVRVNGGKLKNSEEL